MVQSCLKNDGSLLYRRHEWRPYGVILHFQGLDGTLIRGKYGLSESNALCAACSGATLKFPLSGESLSNPIDKSFKTM